MPAPRAVFVGMTYLAEGNGPVVVHVDLVEPRVVTDTAQARVSFFVCSVNLKTAGGAIGSAYPHDMQSFCTRLVPASDVDMAAGLGRDQVVMRVQPTQPGMTKINGMNMTYSTAGQAGTQATGFTVLIKVG